MQAGGPALRLPCLIETECRMMDQLAARLGAIERKRLNELRWHARKPQARERPKFKPAIVSGVADKNRAAAVRPQSADGFRHQSRADPLTMPRRQNSQRANQSPAILGPDRCR